MVPALVARTVRGYRLAGVCELVAQSDLERRVTEEEGKVISLHAYGRCQPTGGNLVCGGHFDHYGSYLVWTRHFLKTTRYKVVPYDHPAPEVINQQSA